MPNPYLFSNLVIKKNKNIGELPSNDKLVFGKYFSDHMLVAEWDIEKGWSEPSIVPKENISMPLQASCLHYAIQCFEGMKAYRSPDGETQLLFRPIDNCDRFQRSCSRLALPTIDSQEMLKSLAKLVQVDSRFIPEGKGYSLYMRPTMISMDETLGIHPPKKALFFTICSPVGPYFTKGLKPISLLADPKFVRAFPGGTGGEKLGANYGPTIHPQLLANAQGYDQMLYVFGENYQITECGAMNLFTYWINEQGEKELITAPIDGTVLPGVTRASVIDICKNEFGIKVTENRPYTMHEFVKASNEGRILEVFTSGTAAIVCPVEKIGFKGVDHKFPAPDLAKKVLDRIMQIQYGDAPHKWCVKVDEVLKQ